MGTKVKDKAVAVRYFSAKTEHVCRLCFASTTRQGINIDETLINIKTKFLEENISIKDMFNCLGVSFEPLLPQTICPDCTKAAISSYTFKKLNEYSKKIWVDVLEQLNKCLNYQSLTNSLTKSVYLIIDKKDNCVIASKKKHSFDIGKATQNLNDIFYNRTKYLKNKQSIKDKNFCCEKCGHKCHTKFQLKKHINRHLGHYFPCAKCEKVFLSRIDLKRHIERIHLPKTVKCTKCDKIFSTHRQLDFHVQKHHVAVNCSLCKLPFPSKAVLKLHINKHDMQQCPRCDKKFLNKVTFKQHVSRCGDDTSQQNFFCDVCGKGYLRKNGLKSHLKVDHGFGDVLVCNWCGKRFDAVSKLRNHEVKHTRERNFTCDQCEGKFVTKAALLYHTRLHTGERPYPCDLCGEKFLSASRRMEHKRRKHFKPSVECIICDAKFRSKSQMKKHLKCHLNPQSKLYYKPKKSNCSPISPLTDTLGEPSSF